MEMSVKEQRSPGRRDSWFYSPWFAVVALLLVLLATLLAHKNPSGALPILVVPFGVAAFALLVLLGRREEGGPGRGGLAICHFSLLVMIILIGLGRMTYLQGWVEVPTGGWFDGPLMGEEKGPWHGGNLDQARFRNLGFVVDFGPDLRPLKTRNRVEWLDASGQSVILEIGEGHPLVLANFRFSTSSNKGYAPMFMWLPAQGGEAVAGGVHLPSFPLFDGQSNHWQIPDTELKILTLLQFDEPFPHPDKSWQFPGAPRHHLVMTLAGESWEMRPGERRTLPQGVLLYQGLGSWMGYRVWYDWTMPWLLAAALVATLGLLVYLVGRFARDPWHRHWGEGR